ncbi:MAG: hypothetical protein ACI4MQ_06270 [Candidatus Coproplasma sp.]
MAFCSRTFAVAKKLKSDINTILFVATIIVNCIFFLFYGYSIYINIDKTVYLVIYSLLAATAIINFVTYLATYKKEKDVKISLFTRLVRIFRYVVNTTSLVVSIYQMIQFGATDFNKILLIVSAASLVIQIIIELVRIFIERYIELFTTSLKMDFALIFSSIEKLNKIKEAKGNVFELIDAPLEAIANKLEGKAKEEAAVSATEQYIDELTAQYNEEAKKEKKRKKAENKAKIKQHSADNAEQQKKEIGEHLKIIKYSIFKKKK